MNTTEQLIREPRRTHQVTISEGNVVVVSSHEGEEALTLSLGEWALQLDASAAHVLAWILLADTAGAEALASILLAHAEWLR